MNGKEPPQQDTLRTMVSEFFVYFLVIWKHAIVIFCSVIAIW